MSRNESIRPSLTQPPPKRGKETQPRKRNNPNLCDRCQAWDDVLTLATTLTWTEPPPTLEELSRNSNVCSVCRAIVTFVQVGVAADVPDDAGPEQQSQKATAWIHEASPSEIFIHPTRLWLWDTPKHHSSISQLVGHNHGLIRILVNLSVFYFPPHTKKPTRMHEWAFSHRTHPPEYRMEARLRFCLQYSSDNPPALKSVSQWGEYTYFPVPLLRSWIEGCETLHRGYCDNDSSASVPAELPPEFRLIDVFSMRVIQPTVPESFVALSYMWRQGGCENGEEDRDVQLQRGNVAKLESVGGLGRVKLPGVLSDAIRLCWELGKSYIWIDRLCIIQDDARSKHGQISQMDKIYRSADLTIVAALNSRNGPGLPGFRDRPRHRNWETKRCYWFGPLEDFDKVIGTPNIIKGFVDSSLWNKRGWTFQERLMSRRCLFITEQEVAFQCRRGCASEERTQHINFRTREAFQDIAEDERPSWIEHGRMPGFRIISSADIFRSFTPPRPIYYFGNLPPLLGSDNLPPSLRSYFQAIRDYTGRDLSFKSDILNAFAGASNMFGSAIGTRMVYGLPEKYLPTALMWGTWSGSRLEDEVKDIIPSWTWASAAQPACVGYYIGAGDYGSHQWRHLPHFGGCQYASLVMFYFQDPDHGFRKLDVAERWTSHENALDELSRQPTLPIPAAMEPSAQDSPGLRARDKVDVALITTEAWKRCPHNPWTSVLRCSNLDTESTNVARCHPGSLIFNTTVASLKIGCVLKRKNKREYYTIAAKICNKDGNVVGWVHSMSREWTDKLRDETVAPGLEQEWDFIVICGATVDRYDPEMLKKFKSRGIFWPPADFPMAFACESEDSVRGLWRLLVLAVERISLKPYVVRRKAVGYIKMHEWASCEPRWETVVLC